jgi:Ca2+-binding EF-hand superfamily protein
MGGAGGYSQGYAPMGGAGGYSQGYVPTGGAGGHPQGYRAPMGGPGGFATFRDPVPPPGADPKLWSCFVEVDADHSGNISVQELQRALVNGDWTPFDLDTVKLLLDLFDADQSGEIDFHEFAGLWKYIEEWKLVFEHFDKDRSGTIDGFELQSAMNQFGMKIPPNLMPLVLAKFSTSISGSQVGDQSITFDRFVRACVFLKQFMELFANIDTDKDGWVQLSYEQFMRFYFTLP